MRRQSLRMLLTCQLLLLLCFQMASAEPRSSSVLQVQELIRTQVDRVPFAEILEQLQNQLSTDPANTRGDQAHYFFRKYLDARIRKVPLIHRAQVEHALQSENMTLEYVDTRMRPPEEKLVHGELNRFDGALGKIMLRLPLELEGTFLDYAIRVHELEHLIQFLHLDGQTVEHDRPEHVDFVFEAERGAMLAEAVYLMAVPRSLLLREVEVVESIPRLSQLDKDFLKGLIRGTLTSKVPEDYVQHQWQAEGRYTKAYIKARIAREKSSMGPDKCEDFLGSIVRIWNDLF